MLRNEIKYLINTTILSKVQKNTKKNLFHFKYLIKIFGKLCKIQKKMLLNLTAFVKFLNITRYLTIYYFILIKEFNYYKSSTTKILATTQERQI